MRSPEPRLKPDHEIQLSNPASVVQPAGSESKQGPNTPTPSQAESLLAAEKRTLEMLANGASLREVLNDLCASIDAHASPVASMTQKQCSGIPGEVHRAIYLLLAGIVSPATPALARAKAAQANMSIRNPKTNAWEMELRITAATAESKSEGRSRPASLIAFD